MVWKEVRVRVAELRAVRKSEIREPAVAHRLPQQIQIAGDVGGAHVRGNARMPAEALSRERADAVEERPLLLAPVREGGLLGAERHLRVVAVETTKRLRRAHAARIEAHHVELPSQPRLQVRAEAAQDQTDPRAARPTRIDEHRADLVARIAGGESRERDAGRGAARVVVPERHGGDGAVGAWEVRTAGRPGQRRHRDARATVVPAPRAQRFGPSDESVISGRGSLLRQAHGVSTTRQQRTQPAEHAQPAPPPSPRPHLEMCTLHRDLSLHGRGSALGGRPRAGEGTKTAAHLPAARRATASSCASIGRCPRLAPSPPLTFRGLRRFRAHESVRRCGD